MFKEDPRCFMTDSFTLNGVAQRGVFVSPHSVEFGLVSGNSPQMYVAASATAQRGDTVIFEGATYTVAAIIDDKTAVQILELEIAE